MELNKYSKIIGGVAIFFVVIVAAYLFLSMYHPGAGLYVSARQIQEEPDNFVEFTPEELEKYPYIHKAVFSPEGRSKVPHDDEEVMDNLDKFDLIMYNNSTEFMKVGENYYQFGLEWAD